MATNYGNFIVTYQGNYNAGVPSYAASQLFTSGVPQSNSQMDSYAQNSLVKALQLYSDQKYQQAITQFKRAIGYSPLSQTALNAYDYMAKSYLQLGDTHSAINTYKKSITADPTLDTTHVSLGNIYYSQGDYASAVKQYQSAAKLNPSSSNLYSLGQGYMADGQYNNAMNEFAQVRRMEPKQPYGEFGMGQVYAKQGQYTEAIAAFQKAIKIAPQDWNAYSEMGYALADSGQLDQAQQVADALQPNSAALASQLSSYINDKTKPQIVKPTYIDLATPFLTVMGPGSKVADLGNYNLISPNTQQTFSISFQFSKPMDPSSVQNAQNWTITRAENSTYTSGDYNFGQAIPSTEALLPYNPTSVFYDPSTLTATVLFPVTQNSAGNATIDPSHIQFTFNGTDVNGTAMDPTANEYTGFSGVA